MNIVLIGYRGTGKSCVGRLLAERYARPLIALDNKIVMAAGMSIPEIVEKFGWTKFREMETAEARKLAGLDNLVIDCGGGIIERAENIEILQQNAKVFWLKASAGKIVERIKDDNQRPALVEGKTFTEEVTEMLVRREPKYRCAAHHEIDSDQQSPDKVAEQIVRLLDM